MNNIEVTKPVWRAVKRPSVATLWQIKTQQEKRITLGYMALLAAILT
jgi:hypothetical protein